MFSFEKCQSTEIEKVCPPMSPGKGAKMPILTRKASLFSNTDVAIVAKCLVQTPAYKSI